MSDWEQQKWVKPFTNESNVRERFLKTGYNSGFLYHHWKIEPGLGATKGQPDLVLFMIVDGIIELCYVELKALETFKLRDSQVEEFPHICATQNLLFAVNGRPGERYLQVAELDKDKIERKVDSFGHYFGGEDAWREIARVIRRERDVREGRMNRDGFRRLAQSERFI